MKREAFTFSFESGELPAFAYDAESPRATLLFGHGAGASQQHPSMIAFAERMQARGVSVITYDFPYTAQKRKLPDPPDVLEAATRAALGMAAARAGGRVFAGGKSMGGRIASLVAAKDHPTYLAGLVFLGYPLHPPKKPEQLRVKHLPDVKVPMLFVQGTRDPFGGPAELAPFLSPLANARIHPVEGGDHSQVVPKRAGVPQDAIDRAIADAIVRWMDEVAA